MFFSKISTKSYFLSVAILVVAMLSVSIANVFGGYYCSVAAIETILFTVFMYNLFDDKINFKENIVCISLVSLITLFEIVFFVINDMFGVDVYVKNDFGFLSVLVLISQIISIISIIYLSVCFTLRMNKLSHIEIVEETDKNEKIDIEDSENEENVKNNFEEQEGQQEIKSISDNNIKVDTPFMEEER